MPTGFDTGLPSSRQIQSMIKDQKQAEVKLISGETLNGQILWQDQFCIGVVDENNESSIVWRHAIAYVKPK
ncbi:Hfq-related RNA-binding protein [Argonema antarcticum]|uniref:Hfq-related RNA-binding protein n=1 Tax=Argonema antarcticum TaxID=2942763 RepID=UPI00201246FF|nr:RNA chaperone Hfq [Argonema antarcticum]MCL1469419.1 RNA chaperone Hfq [Argonema antarcticum A004/B2]